MRKTTTLLALSILAITILVIGCTKDSFQEDAPSRGFPTVTVSIDKNASDVFTAIQEYEGTNANELKRLSVIDIREVMINKPVQADRSFADSLDITQYVCYAVRYGATPDGTQVFCPSMDVFLDLVGNYGQPSPNSWNLLPGDGVNMSEILAALTGFGITAPNQPSIEDYIIDVNFGEGNTMMAYTGSNKYIAFGWLHRTPYDEPQLDNYNAYNINTWNFDVVGPDPTTSFYYR